MTFVKLQRDPDALESLVLAHFYLWLGLTIKQDADTCPRWRDLRHMFQAAGLL